jgi:polar amino acid transport system ATP-binding protein
LSESDKEAKIKEYVHKWGLETCIDKYPNELSGGQRQRTAIIEQLFSSDHFIVFDEPFSGLDVGNIEEVKNAFQLLNSTSDFNTIIFSTHDIELAIQLAQAIYIIGHPTIAGVKQPYGTIVGHYDLRETGLFWKERCEEHSDLHREIVEKMMVS